MAVIKPPAHDRLLSAIRSSANALTGAANLHSLLLELENGILADYWSNRFVNDKRLLSVLDAEEYVDRKAKGIALLQRASDGLAASRNRPVLSLYHTSNSTRPDKKEFGRRLPGLFVEAEKYGWEVDPDLKDLNW